MKQTYRWGDVAPPAVEAMRKRRRWLMNSAGFKNWRAALVPAAPAPMPISAEGVTMQDQSNAARTWSGFDSCKARLSLQISLGTSVGVTEGGLPTEIVICAHVWNQSVDGGPAEKVLMAVRRVSVEELKRLVAFGNRGRSPAEPQGNCSAACTAPGHPDMEAQPAAMQTAGPSARIDTR